VVSRRVFGMVEPWVEGNSLEELNLKRFQSSRAAGGDFAVAGRSGRCWEAAAEAPRRRQQQPS
jgi:hypothetical protein